MKPIWLVLLLLYLAAPVLAQQRRAKPPPRPTPLPGLAVPAPTPTPTPNWQLGAIPSEPEIFKLIHGEDYAMKVMVRASSADDLELLIRRVITQTMLTEQVPYKIHSLTTLNAVAVHFSFEIENQKPEFIKVYRWKQQPVTSRFDLTLDVLGRKDNAPWWNITLSDNKQRATAHEELLVIKQAMEGR